MRIIKSFVTAVVFLLAFESLISAEMTVMSLQERIRQSDLVVVGEILEAHNTGKETETGTEHWLATCRVERYITNKTHDPDAEVLKRVNTIRIRFVQIPQQKPAPLELSEGKKYLLFLRDRGSQYQGEVAYEMITLYHGAFEAGQDYFVHDEQSPEYPQAVKMSFEEIVQRVTQKSPASVDIREQLNSATAYWYAYFREKMLGEGRALRNVHTEGEWTVTESFGKHGFTPLRVLTRFLDAEETKIEGIQLTLNGVKASLRSSIPSEVEEGIREIEILTGMNLKANACASSEKCLQWIENNEDYFFWDENKNILNIAEERRINLGIAVMGLTLSIKTDKTIYSQNEPIVLTVKLENILPASGVFCTVFLVNARMLIHSEIVFDVRTEKGEELYFLPPEPPPALTAKDFRMLDGGQSIESQEEIASRLGKRPLSPGVYRIQATYQNYELGKTLGLSPSCAGDSVLLEGGPAWTGKLFSNTITVKIE